MLGNTRAGQSQRSLELAGGGRTYHKFASSQLDGLMLRPAGGMLCKQNGDDVPARAKHPG